ncbi:MAG: hypothetical protein ACKOF3_11105 [Spartobacteria bacterium]
MRIFSILACFFVAATALAQQSGDSKKRMLFSNTAPSPAATPASAMEPVELLQRFFEALKADKLDAAYEGLAKNTIVASKAENLEQLKKRTRDAFDNFGPVKGYEVVETLEIGKALFRQTCISLNEDLPLRWRFYFYRSEDKWKLVDLRVDDGIVELFDEVARNRRK